MNNYKQALTRSDYFLNMFMTIVCGDGRYSILHDTAKWKNRNTEQWAQDVMILMLDSLEE